MPSASDIAIIYNAVVLQGITPESATATGIRDAIDKLMKVPVTRVVLTETPYNGNHAGSAATNFPENHPFKYLKPVSVVGDSCNIHLNGNSLSYTIGTTYDVKNKSIQLSVWKGTGGGSTTFTVELW